jgi:hypothetical protein
MAYEIKDGQGSLFKNDKDGNEKRPDCTGYVQIDGVMYNLAGWWKDSKSGSKFLSLKATVKEEQQENGDETDLPF